MKKIVYFISLFMLILTLSILTSTAYATNGYYDSFNSLAVGGDPTGWVTSGDWGIITGAAAPTWGVHGDYTKYYKYNSGSTITYYNTSYTNFDYISTIMLTSNTTGAVIFRRTSDTNYYYYKLDAVNNRAIFGKCVNGANTDLASITFTIDPNICYHLRVTAVGESITCKILNGNNASFFRAQDPGTVVANMNDATFPSGYCGFLATGGTSDIYNEPSVIDLSKDISMSNSTFSVKTGAYGEIQLLKFLNEPYDTNFVANEMEHRYEVGKNQFLGELKFKYQVGTGSLKTATTGDSDDIRNIVKNSATSITVSYLANSASNTGIKGATDFQVTETYSLVEDHLKIDISIKNMSGQNIRFNDIGLPISWNNHWQFESPYEKYLAATGNFISYNGSYLVLERAKGGGNKLLFTPDSVTDTSIEYRKFISTQATWTNPPEEYYIKSNTVKSEGQGYIPSTYLDLASGATKTYSFKIHKIANDLEVGTALYNEGLIDVKVDPGMILPKNITAKVDLHTSKTINSLNSTDPANTTITSVGTVGTDHKIYNITFNKLGRNDITINYDGNKKMVLQFWVEEPLANAIQRRVDFLINNCRITNPADPHYKGFLEWNNVTNVAKTGGNGCNNNDYEQMYDGPSFIAEKNVYYPVQSEVTIIDDYLMDLVWAKEVIHGGADDGFLCHQCCSGRCWNDTYPAVYPYRCTRPYNYPRIYNTFFSMYNVAKNYPNLTFRWTKNQYLEAVALILKRSIPNSYGLGLMGEQTTPDIIQALRDEGYTTTANEISTLAQAKCNTLNQTAYPFGSEFGTDSTGEEGAYYYSKFGNNTTGMLNTINKSMAWTLKVPVWYWQTTGNRQDGDWWLFQYTVGLHGALFNDYYMNYAANGKDYWSIVYPFKLAPFVHVNSGQPECIGAVGTNWGNYMSSKPYNWNIGFPYSESAESDISLWAGLQLLSADVVTNDLSFGLAGYGCDVADGSTTYNITPKDGLFRRLNIVDNKLAIQLQTDRYTFAKVGKNNDYVEFTLTNVTGVAHNGTISIKGLVAGDYDVLVNGTIQKSISVATAGTLANFTYDLGTTATNTVIIRKNATQLLVAEAGNDSTIILPASASLNGSVVGTPTLTNWSKQSGPGAVTFGNSNALVTTASFSVSGTYILKLTVSDSTHTSIDTVTITVRDPAYEAESATLTGLSSGTTHAGYSGTGYLYNFRNNAVNSNVQFNVTASSAGSKTMTIRYINEFSSCTNLGLYVNGVKIKNLTLAGTGGYNVWGEATETINLNAENNTIKINIETSTDTTINGLDYISISGSGTPPQNAAPTVSAGTNSTVTPPSSITLSGTASDDGLPSGTLTTTWSLQSGPGTATIANASALNTTATVTVAGTYVFKLTASDGSLSSTSTVTKTVNPPSIANLGTPTTSFCSDWESVNALNDGFDPTNSGGRAHLVYGNWNNPGTTQWVQYDFSQNYTINSIDVYWFSDKASGGGIDVPASCSVQYWNGSAWVNVSNPVGLGVAANMYNTTTFTEVATNKIRLNITAQSSYSTGILEWKVYGTASSSSATKYEAESATLTGLSSSTTHAGYSGTGYLYNFRNNVVNNNVLFNVTASSAGSKTMTIRYINEFSSCTNLGLYVNGVKIKNLTLAGTGGYNVWGEATETINLNAGNNTIKINIETSTDTTINGLDYISIQ